MWGLRRRESLEWFPDFAFDAYQNRDVAVYLCVWQMLYILISIATASTIIVIIIAKKCRNSKVQSLHFHFSWTKFVWFIDIRSLKTIVAYEHLWPGVEFGWKITRVPGSPDNQNHCFEFPRSTLGVIGHRSYEWTST